MKRTLFVFALMFALMFVLSACGGSGKPSNIINVTLAEFIFTPSTFTIPAGQEITINAVNNGAVVHNFVIMKLGTTAGGTWVAANDANVFWRLQLDSGSSKSIAFTAPTDPGDYQVVCSTPGHLEAGMIATLKVVAGQ